MIKKLLSAMAIAAVAVPALGQDGTVLASYDVTEGDLGDWTNTVQVPKETFAKCQEGNMIRVTGVASEAVTDDKPAQVQLVFKDEDYTWTEFVKFANVVDGKYEYVLEGESPAGIPADEIIVGLQWDGLYIKGQNFTVTNVSLIGEAKQDPIYKTISSFPVENGELIGWNNIIEIPETAFADMRLNDIVRIKGIPSPAATADAPAQVQLALKDEDWSWTEIVKSADVEGDFYDYTVEDEEVLAMFKLHGLNVKGQNFTVTEIEVLRLDEGGETPTEKEITNYDVADGELVGWNNIIEIPETVFADMELNDIVRIVGTIAPEATEDAPGQVQLALKDEDWSWTEIVKSADVVGDHFDYVVESEEYLGYFKLHGLNIKGQNFTVTNVKVIRMGTGGDEPDEPVEPAEYREVGFFVPADGYVGYTENNDAWSEVVSVPATLFADCAKTDRIIVEASNIDNAQIQLAYKDENYDWTNLVEAADFVDGSYMYELTGKKGPAGLALHGLFIKGQNLEVTKVTLMSNREISAVGQIMDENADYDAPVEIYTLDGVRVSEMTKGIYIVRKGSKVRKVIR